jgi:hypothetical protein
MLFIGSDEIQSRPIYLYKLYFAPPLNPPSALQRECGRRWRFCGVGHPGWDASPVEKTCPPRQRHPGRDATFVMLHAILYAYLTACAG